MLFPGYGHASQEVHRQEVAELHRQSQGDRDPVQ